MESSNISIFRVNDFLADSHKFCQNVELLAKQNGAKFHYSSKVKQILSENGHVTGIKLENGDVHRADIGTNEVNVHCTVYTVGPV